jgi:hypothetical protein
VQVGGKATLSAIVLALAAPAGAQTIAVNATCFVNGNPKVGTPITVSGSGFTAGDTVTLQASGISGSTTVGGTGTFTSTLAGPTLSTRFPAWSQFTLTARDTTRGATEATTSFAVANLAFETKPAVARPSQKVRFSFSGFRSGAIVYGHYLRGRKTVATERFGRTNGSCGVLKSKARLFPGGHPAFGTYKIQFDDSRRYRANALPRILTGLTIKRRR